MGIGTMWTKPATLSVTIGGIEAGKPKFLKFKVLEIGLRLKKKFNFENPRSYRRRIEAGKPKFKNLRNLLKAAIPYPGIYLTVKSEKIPLDAEDLAFLLMNFGPTNFGQWPKSKHKDSKNP